MIIEDYEFGEIVVRRNSLAKSVKFTLDNSGRISLIFPAGVSDSYIKKIVEMNRGVLRQNFTNRVDPETQRARDQKIKLLKKEAKNFLPHRLAYLAKIHGFRYSKIRITYPTTRWGSCSSNGTISLSIALMKLPSNLRDHVILHELNHLRHMDHSVAFWRALTKLDPKTKYHNQMLKNYNPAVWD